MKLFLRDVIVGWRRQMCHAPLGCKVQAEVSFDILNVEFVVCSEDAVREERRWFAL
jgi:hypothetical protein